MSFLARLLRRASGQAPGNRTGGPDALDDARAEATLRQAVGDMRAQLNQAVQAAAEAMTARNRLETEHRQLRVESEQWRERARGALDSGDEDRARQALVRKQECERELEALEPSLESARRAGEALGGQVARLRLRIEEAERNAAALIARRNAAAAKKRIARAIDGVGHDDDAFAALGALEESAVRAEAEAEIQALAGVPDDELEREFRALERPGLEAELEALRREAIGRNPPPSTGDQG